MVIVKGQTVNGLILMKATINIFPVLNQFACIKHIEIFLK